CLLSAVPLRDDQRNIVYYEGICQDITERKESEKKLSILSERLQLAIQTANAGIWSWDIVNDELTWDERMHHLYRVKPGQFSGGYDAWEKVLHPDDMPASREAIQLAIQGKADLNNEFRVVWPDGSIRHIKANAAVQCDSKGNPLYMVGMNWDITAHKNAIMAAQAANRSKSQFLANMTHELRTPMTGVLGMTELLADTPLTDKQRSYVERIKTSGESLLGIINDILDISKIEAGKMAFESIPFSIEKVFSETESIFGYQAASKGINFRKSIDHEISPVLIGDPQRLKQIISNLLTNAVKFTKAGSIELSALARNHAAEDVMVVEISVSDTGIGIKEKERLRIFDAFSQADASTTRRFGGSGLGLTISKQLVELMGGTIHLESTPGRGSVFTFLIPYKIAPEGVLADSSPEVQYDYRFVDVRALLVEDNEIIRDIIYKLMRNMGIAVETAQNGQEALEMVGNNDYDIVLMDIQMPEMDGLEATRKIRALRRKNINRLPILALTAHGLSGDSDKTLAAGMNDHLTKPVNQNILKEALRRWLPPEKCRTAPTSATKSVPDHELPNLPKSILDMAIGLRNVGGNHAFYIKTMSDFVVRYGNTAELLTEEVNAGRFTDAARRIHSIKGVAGYLGSKELEAAASELGKSLRAMDSDDRSALREPLQKFFDLHHALTEDIGAVLDKRTSSPPVKEEPQGSDEELIPLLTQLKVSLESFTPKPCREIMGKLLQKKWSLVSNDELEELNLLVQRYRYSDARDFFDKKFCNIIR
ncbi:MAG: ATP-binding protein, partial [Syntrophus sp. (in: bacteria)]